MVEHEETDPPLGDLRPEALGLLAPHGQPRASLLRPDQRLVAAMQGSYEDLELAHEERIVLRQRGVVLPSCLLIKRLGRPSVLDEADQRPTSKPVHASGVRTTGRMLTVIALPPRMPSSCSRIGGSTSL